MYQRLINPEGKAQTTAYGNRSSMRSNAVLGAASLIGVLLIAYWAYPSLQSWHTDDLLDATGNRTLGFEKILVVSLPTRTDKRDGVLLAAAFSDVDIEFIDGVTDVDPKVLPPGGEESGRTPGEYGNWRAHMNAVKYVVEHNLESALIMEDDADWDVRIKQQMRDFALASRALLQPVKGTLDSFLDLSRPSNEKFRGSDSEASERAEP